MKPGMPHFARLDSPACTLILEVCEGEAPLWRYWGPRLPADAMPATRLRALRPETSFALAFDQPLSVFPGAGLGWFGQTALLAHRDGGDWAHAVMECTIERPDPASLCIGMRDAVAGLNVALSMTLDPETDVLSISTRLTNAGPGAFDVQWLASGGVPLPPGAREVRSFAGRHNGEFVPVTDPLTRSLWRRENRRGLTSHDCFPGAVVMCADGAAYGAQLAWSGNHAQQIDWLDDGRWHWQMGEWLAPGEVRLAPGESIETPEMLATCSADGANGVAWAFHRAVRQRIGWPGGAMTPRPVHLNTWEGVYFDHDLDALKAQAALAAELGIERFVLDDGWFEGRNDDTSSLGDWRPDRAKYPDGLGPLAAHVTGLGMQFGLWVEPEMVNPDSALFRVHPDWALQTEGRPLLTGRNQLVLDLTRSDVSDYLFDAVSALLGRLPITYLKWDHNRDLTHAGHRPLYRRQVLAAYALIDRLRHAFPAVEIEACAGGGGRIDAGMARRTHRFWASDNNDAVSRVAIQSGFLQFMPPELMGAHIGAARAHGTGRTQSLTFRGMVALAGHLGVELDVRTLGDADRDRLAALIALYKEDRARLHGGRVWMGEAPDGLLWQAHGTADALLLFVTRIAPANQRHAPSVRLDMLDPDARYRVARIGDDEVIASGAWLRAHGLDLAPMRGETVLRYAIDRVSAA
jgi:alpha-galactosidase